MDTALVIPVFNEAATIREVVLQARDKVDQVIVVDDGSADETTQRLQDLDIHLLRHESNKGKAAALQYGFSHALSLHAKTIITLDGDGQHNPEEIPKLLDAVKSRPDTIIIAARLKQRQNAPKLRLFANRFADFWVSWAAGYPVIDSQSGFRLYPDKMLNSVQLDTAKQNGFVYESEILIEAANNNFYSISIPVESIYRKEGRESHYRPWTDTWRIVRMIAWRLIRKGMYPSGLFRSLKILPDPRNQPLG
ncbi:MAG: glycosyltransferase family 2 protein [Candidatus Thiodiazotropha sp. (ex Notomyrtea botanica)]|nr:glycosyltransferase family 2 protein [Candidatus Thiodiazotropha sp. (ex Notomyrtea botanica)]